MRLKWIGIAVLVLAVAVGGLTLRTLWLAGAFRGIEPHFDGTCRLVEGAVGPEDITIDGREQVAYVSASDRRATAAGAPVPGAIYRYDLRAADAEPVNLTPGAGASFQPHGISLWTDGERSVLFVINHPAPNTALHDHTVEIFDLEGGALVHRATLTSPLLVMPNDLVAVDRDRFYLTNTHGHPPGWRQTLETYLQLPWGNVLSYGPRGFDVALDGLTYPNGINVSADGGTLYVATVTARSLLVYDRDPDSGQLTRRDEVALGSGGDNVEIDERGDVWIGAHPKLLRVQAHATNPSELSPAQVLRVSRGAGGTYEVEEIYLSDGAPLSGSSVAAVHGDRMLIGQIFGDGFLDCRLGR
jgi:arylesterase/paraoxonase